MRRLALLLLLLFPLAALQSPAEAATKAGQTCKKLGSKTTSNGMRFTCIKSGKRMVWSKGVSVKPVAPVVLKTGVEKWRELGSGANAVWDQWKPAADIGKQSHTLSMSFTFEPLVPQNVRDEVTRQYRISGAFWDQYLDYRENTQIIVAMYGQGRFLCEQRAIAFGQSIENQNCDYFLGKPPIAGSTPALERTGAKNLGGEMNWYVIESFADFDSRMMQPRIHHEFVHTVAFSQNPYHWWTNACWFEEGWAEWFGALIGSEGNQSRFLNMRNYTATGNVRQQLGRYASTSTPADWAVWLSDTSITKFKVNDFADGCGPYASDGIYNSAILAVEYMVSKFGVPGVLAFQRDVANIGWTPAIEKIFGKPQGEAYLELGAYMRHEYLLIVANPIVFN